MTEVTRSAQRGSVPALVALRLGLAVLLARRPGESRLVAGRELASGLVAEGLTAWALRRAGD